MKHMITAQLPTDASSIPTVNLLIGSHVLLQVDEVGRWNARYPRLPECSARGATLQEALANLNQTLAAHYEDSEQSWPSIDLDH